MPSEAALGSSLAAQTTQLLLVYGEIIVSGSISELFFPP